MVTVMAIFLFVVHAIPTILGATSSMALCDTPFSHKCSSEVYNTIFKEATVRPSCCMELVSLGKSCHDVYINFVVGKMHEVNKTQKLEKSEGVWNQCVAITHSIKSKASKAFRECEKKHFSNKCSSEVYNSIFKEGTVRPSCCMELVSLGKSCHDVYIKLAVGKVNEVNKTPKLEKSERVWNQCVAITHSMRSRASDSKIFNECEKKNFSKRCSSELHDSIFKGSTVHGSCCMELVGLGKSCHDVYLNRASSKKPEVNKTQVLEKGRKVWKRCLAVTHSPEVPTFGAADKKIFQECERKHFSKKCSSEVIDSITKEASVCESCCKELVALGKPCHDVYVKWVIGKERGFNQTQTLAKSEHIWNQCVAVTHSRDV